MKIQYTIGLVAVLLGLMFACNNDEKKAEVTPKATKTELKESIDEMKDSLKTLVSENKKVENLHRIELINRLLDYYHNYPQDDYSAECLDEVQMIYSMLEAYEYAAAYSDTLLESYPKYSNRALVLESQGANYDIFITPRDSNKVRKYYTMLLDEFPKLDKDKQEGIRKRLKKNSLSFDEYIEDVTSDLK